MRWHRCNPLTRPTPQSLLGRWSASQRPTESARRPHSLPTPNMARPTSLHHHTPPLPTHRPTHQTSPHNSPNVAPSPPLRPPSSPVPTKLPDHVATRTSATPWTHPGNAAKADPRHRTCVSAVSGISAASGAHRQTHRPTEATSQLTAPPISQPPDSDRLSDPSTDRPSDCPAHRQSAAPAPRPSDRPTARPTSRQHLRPTDRPAATIAQGRDVAQLAHRCLFCPSHSRRNHSSTVACASSLLYTPTWGGRLQRPGEAAQQRPWEASGDAPSLRPTTRHKERPPTHRAYHPRGRSRRSRRTDERPAKMHKA